MPGRLRVTRRLRPASWIPAGRAATAALQVEPTGCHETGRMHPRPIAEGEFTVLHVDRSARANTATTPGPGQNVEGQSRARPASGTAQRGRRRRGAVPRSVLADGPSSCRPTLGGWPAADSTTGTAWPPSGPAVVVGECTKGPADMGRRSGLS